MKSSLPTNHAIKLRRVAFCLTQSWVLNHVLGPKLVLEWKTVWRIVLLSSFHGLSSGTYWYCWLSFILNCTGSIGTFDHDNACNWSHFLWTIHYMTLSFTGYHSCRGRHACGKLAGRSLVCTHILRLDKESNALFAFNRCCFFLELPGRVQLLLSRLVV